MGSMLFLTRQSFVSALTLTVSVGASAQAVWTLDTRGASGPIAQVALPSVGPMRRMAFIAFEYARRCDPIFSFLGINGTRLGTPTSRSVLRGSKIGVVVNGKFHTWHAAMTNYSNGYEAAFGITNELFDLLTGKIDSLTYVTPDGEHIPMPIAGFRQSVESALDACTKRVK